MAVLKRRSFLIDEEGTTGAELLSTYDERSRIEETHRQLKGFQGIEKLPSKKWSHVVFRILMGVVIQPAPPFFNVAEM